MIVPLPGLTQAGALPQWWLLVYKPQQLQMYSINPSEIVVMLANLAISDNYTLQTI